ncbi:MAG: ATP-binding protein [Anaerolineales bacterium]|nr:ATP-binding protein [Anaerolineales bacterium]
MTDFERLGVFYLGKEYDLAARQAKESLLLYDSKDLVTHAVCVGMTGSGKTGLCLSLLEEAAIDGVPAIIIDPKGDLPNLLLTFPELRAEDFRPWINEDDAAQKGFTPEAFAQQQADLWRKGLGDWGQDGARIQRLRDSSEIRVYTPGSNSGIPISILKSFAAPDPAVIDDAEAMRDRVSTAASSLLSLAGVDADPLQSREHILVSTILDSAWRTGQDLDVASLIGQIQNPPFTKVGVLDLESFYPSKERFGLVMALNNLLASPGFAAWLEGEPLDVQRLLYTPAGRPRLAIFSIAHLSDAQRMFFVALLLNQVLGWARAQSGTTSLRALLYMDEIFGYFPPTANPPSKPPLLTLLKQARAFGLGVVLATQNPVDLDYKGLGNTGTWFIGRLQTDRDKQRVLDGLEGAATGAGSGFDRAAMDTLLSGLGNRVFLMNNVHDNGPVVFTTRWAMSYLRGPLTRQQIKTLMDPFKPAAAPATQPAAATTAAASATMPAPAAVVAAVPAPTQPAPALATGRPSLDPAIAQFFLPLRGAVGGRLVYRPFVYGAASVGFSDPKTRVDLNQAALYLTPVTDNAVPVEWIAAESLEFGPNELERAPVAGAEFAELPPAAAKPKNYAAWGKDFISYLYGTQVLTLLRDPLTKLVSNPSESEGEFRVRSGQGGRERRDAAVEALKRKYAPKQAALQERLRRAEQRVAEQKAQADQAKMQTAISFGATLLGAFTGRKGSGVGRATTAARGVGRAMKEGGDVSRAQETVEAVKEQMVDLEAQFKEDVAALEAQFSVGAAPLETLTIKPKKANINPQLVSLIWAPYVVDDTGVATPAWQ